VARDVSDGRKRTIGDILKHLRQEKLWSQAELAHRIGTTPVSVGRWENNITRPNLHFQRQLCEIFAKSPEDLGFAPQAEPEHKEGSDQNQQTEPGQQVLTDEPASGNFPALAPVPPSPLQRGLISKHGVVWQRRRLLVMLTCLSLFLLLSTLFWFARQHTLSSSAHLPSCQAPSSSESAAAIYAQVMCKHALLSSALDRQDGLRWDENDQCRFRQGAYHVLLPATAYVAECFAHVAPFGPNFALQVDMTVLKGYSGGLMFRAEGPSSNWDVIISRVPIDIWGQYNFDLASTNVPCHLSKDPIAPTYCYSPHGTITYGTGVTNTMTVIALGSQVYLYVNGFFLDQAQAPASSPLKGFFGVFANGSRTTSDVAFRHLQLWNI
jgi:transcriptional regulator with XRE-family HTH domain